MPNNMNKNIWLIGAGQMAVDYHKVLNDLEVPFTVVGRGESSAKLFSERTGVKPFIGGLDNFLKTIKTYRLSKKAKRLKSKIIAKA